MAAAQRMTEPRSQDQAGNAAADHNDVWRVTFSWIRWRAGCRKSLGGASLNCVCTVKHRIPLLHLAATIKSEPHASGSLR
jgi:hypothetical protein